MGRHDDLVCFGLSRGSASLFGFLCRSSCCLLPLLLTSSPFYKFHLYTPLNPALLIFPPLLQWFQFLPDSLMFSHLNSWVRSFFSSVPDTTTDSTNSLRSSSHPPPATTPIIQRRAKFSPPSLTDAEVEEEEKFDRTDTIPHNFSSETLNQIIQQQQQQQRLINSLLQSLSQQQYQSSQQQQQNQSLQAPTPSNSRSTSLPAKIQPLSKFNGEIGAALEVWKRELESHFDYYSQSSISTEEERLRYAVVHLGDAARTWWNSVREANKITTYTAFKEALNDRYRPVLAAQQARTQLRALRQLPRQLVSDYINSFQTLMAHIPDMSDADQVHCFTFGLLPAVGQKVRELTPAHLAAAIGCAVRFEGSLGIGASSYNLPIGTASAPGGVPMDLGAVATDTSATTPATTPGITPAEILNQLNAVIARFASSSHRPRTDKDKHANPTPGGKRTYAHPLAPGMAPGLIHKRTMASLCIKCGESGHFIAGCKNQQKNM
jgi:hypothetical protein